jgi:hypothetical protein
MERKRRAHQRSDSMKCRSEAGVMSDPVGTRADGVEGAVQDRRVQGTRKTESCIGFVEDRLHGWVLFGRGHAGRRVIVLARLHHA